MTKKDNKKEEGLLNFFGDIQLVQKFKELENPQQMIEFMWKAPVFQVCDWIEIKHYNFSYTVILQTWFSTIIEEKWWRLKKV